MPDRDGRNAGPGNGPVDDEKHVRGNGAGANGDVPVALKEQPSTPRKRSTPTATTAAPAPAASSPSLGKRLADTLWPDWLVKALHDKRQWKNWFRAMIALFAMVVIMVCQKSLDALGSATFFGLIAMCMLTPTMPVALYIMAFVTLGLGMCLGWAWGVAAWASALHVRSPGMLQAAMAREQAGYVPNVPVKAQVTQSIFHGAFLDPRSSAVMGVFLFIGTYALGWLRASKPKLILLSIYGTIITDMMATYGPLFPSANYLLAKQLIVPAAAAMAVGIVCAVLFFPQTLNHLLLDGLVRGGLGTIQGLLKMQDEVLRADPDDHATWGALATKAYNLRKAFAAAAGGLSASSKMLQLEVSRGRISAGQLQELVNKTRDLGTHAFGLGSFVLMVEERHQAVERYKAKPMPHHTSRTKQDAAERLRAEHTSGKSLKDLLPDLERSTAELRQAAEEALAGASSWLAMINNTRWKSTPADFATAADRDAARERLIKTLADYRSSDHFAILSRYQNMFDASGNLIPAPERELTAGLRGLFRCFVFTCALIAFSAKLVEYLEFIRVIEASCPKNKLQFPGKFVQTVVENATDSTGGDNEYSLSVNETLADNEADTRNGSMSSDDDDAKTNAKGRGKGKKQRVYMRDPDARDPTNWFQRFGRTLAKVARGLSGPSGIFALRYALVSVALWIPAVCPSSAYFYYKRRGLWALIMAQTGLGIVAGEQIVNVVTRVLGTIFGVVVGMVVWYIGAQKGRGNPYGIAAATMVGVAPFLFLRVVCPPHLMSFWILTTVTVVFTVGYSWTDLNASASMSTDAGYTLGWQRALLVIIGFAAGSIASIFPRPVTAKRSVREGLCKNIAAIGELYGLEVTAFEQSRDDSRNIDMEERRSRYRDRFLKIYGRFGLIEQHIGYASVEPAMKGRWPKEDYEELLNTQATMLAASAIVAGAYSRLNSTWIQRLTDQVDLLHPSFTADCFSLFTILRHSLRHKVALPPMIPIFERLGQYRRATERRHIASFAASRTNLTVPGNASRTNLGVPGNASAVSLGRDSKRDSFKPSPLGQGQGQSQGQGDAQGTLPVPASGLGSRSASSAALAQSRPDTPASEADSVDPDADDRVLLTTDRALWHTFHNAITWEACHDEQFAIFATAIMALMHIVAGLNTMHAIVLDLVGERELEGFDMAQERWAAMDKV